MKNDRPIKGIRITKRRVRSRPALLIADADEKLWDMLEAEKAMAGAKCSLTFVADPAEAWQILHEGMFYGALIDWHFVLPNRVRLAEAVIRSRLVDLVAVTTRRHCPTVETTARRAGAALYLPKPISGRMLQQLLRMHAKCESHRLAKRCAATQCSPPGKNERGSV